jgi:hypothetical protein
VGKWGGEQPLSLGNGCQVAGVVIHEILHALGFYHHHSRSDRDGYLTINWQNIQQGMASQFQKLRQGEDQLFTPFDYGSIMIYGSRAFSGNGQPTMVTKGGQTIQDPGYKGSMTSSDVTAVKALYGCGGGKG